MESVCDMKRTSAERAAGGVPADAISLEVADGFGRCSVTAGEWDEAVERLGGTIYMTWAWLETWWRHYGSGLSLRLCVFRDAGAIVGLLPFYVEELGVWPLKCRVARLVGANLPPKCFDPPVCRERASGVFTLMIEQLAVPERWDMVSLGPVGEEWAGASGLRDATSKAGAGGAGYRMSWVPKGGRTVFDLPDSFEDYLGTLSSGERKGRLKRLRQAEKHAMLRSDVVESLAESGSAFDEFRRMHDAQWQTVGRPGHFRAWPGAGEFNKELTMRQTEHGRIRFFRLWAGEQLVSSRYTFEFGGVLYSELPARAVGEPWDKLGIGVTSMLLFNRDVISRGITRIESGLGGYEHKAGMGGTLVSVGIWRLVSATPLGAARAAFTLMLAKVVDFVFHRVWYRRIAGVLPRTRYSGQGRFWLKYSL